MDRALTGLARMTTARKSTKDLAALDRNRELPPGPQHYEILDDCGRGVSATVHRALCKPLNEIVAIKKMNLESLNCDLEEIIHEAQTMKNYNHPNVLSLYCSFVSGSDLWMIMPFISGGSVLHIMKYRHPDGLDEVVIATIMRDVLKALEYVHKQGGIHRDIKAGNILIDSNGHVWLGDFGVAASMERSGSWGHDKVARMTFVGTPCWMAPEVMEQTSGYDSSADIWSVGITLLEMAHGHAPFAKFPPMKVLLMTLQNPPPTLDNSGKKHFSKSMRDLVTRCLQKDPKMRPTATQLLEHKFFKQARDDEYLARNLMAGLPPLGERVQDIRQGKAATNAMDNDKNFAKSQDEYKKGISSWNFDVAALKAAAANEPEDDEPSLPTITEQDEVAEGTLSGLVASQAAAFVHAQNGVAPAPAGGSSGGGASNASNSVFATQQGQQQLIQAASSSLLPMPVPAEAPLPSAALVPPLVDAVMEVTAAPFRQGNESAPLSPGTVSPSGLSREGSVQGPLNALATTPTASKQKMKQQGRFQIYEPGSEPPPMSPAAGQALDRSSNALVAEGSRLGVPELQTARTSEDGIKRPDLMSQESVFDETISGEPKKKGRFLVVEQSGLAKVGSQASLLDAGGSMTRPGRSEAGKEAGLGRPPPAPTNVPAGTAMSVPVTAILPRLMEILDHASVHQQAIHRLVAAVQDVERGKPSQLLSRTLSTRSLFSDMALGLAPPRAGTGDGAATPPSESAELEALRARLAELEADNLRLKTRNAQLEGVLVHVTSGSLGGPEGHYAQGLSPSEGDKSSPRDE